jgi:hypothetical protein
MYFAHNERLLLRITPAHTQKQSESKSESES